MPVALRPLREDELAAFRARTQAGYVRSMVDEGGMPEEAAEAKGEQDMTTLLAAGLTAPGQHLFALEDTSNGEQIGDLWFAERDSDFGDKAAFIYAIEIFEQFRGHGFGREAMVALEDEVRSRGLGRIALNVFGGNDVARSLYRSAGYAETAVFMSKEL